MSTILIKEEYSQKNWYLIDATDLVLGRLSVVIADILRGKNKPSFANHLDMGDYVIVINADKVSLKAGKEYTKYLFHHTGFPGGIRQTTPRKILDGKTPEKLIRRSVRGMLPHNKLGETVYGKLFVYAGASHPHEAQNPIVFDKFNQKDKI